MVMFLGPYFVVVRALDLYVMDRKLNNKIKKIFSQTYILIVKPVN